MVFQFAFELHRCNGMCGAIKLANSSVPVSFAMVGMPLFGPIFAGSIAGCGGAFLPLDKGLAALTSPGQGPQTAFYGSIFFHSYVNLYGGSPDAGQLGVALFFVVVGCGAVMKAKFANDKKEKEVKAAKKD